ncbi:MAG: PilZ domain-containing protein [Myxococcaceae bacterium]
MTTPRAVRYRCEIQSQIELDTGGDAGRPRVLELSENGAFIEEVGPLAEVQTGDGAVIGIPMPGGDPWVAHVRFTRAGFGRVDVKTNRAEHVSVSVRGFGVEFDELNDDELERLRDFLELLDTR